MPDQPTAQPGDIAWVDLTSPNAGILRDFYAKVVGWTPAPVDMKDYQDFNMNHPETGQPIAGICHQRGPNADLPATWLIYIVVADLITALAPCALYQPRHSDS